MKNYQLSEENVNSRCRNPKRPSNENIYADINWSYQQKTVNPAPGVVWS